MKEFWEERYGEEGYAYGTVANEFLMSQQHRFKPGIECLTVGDGEGRNGVWLAQQGLDVLSVDYSATGMEKARQLAASRKVKLATECVDLTQWQWPVNEYDLVVAIFIHFSNELRPQLHRNMLAALKPGGLIIMEAYDKGQLKYKTGGPPVEELLYSEAILKEDFAEAELLHGEQTIVELHEGKYHEGTSSVLRWVVRKPQR